MITLTSNAPDEFFAEISLRDKIFIRAADGTYEYWFDRTEMKYWDVCPDPDRHMMVPANDGNPYFVYIRGRKL